MVHGTRKKDWIPIVQYQVVWLGIYCDIYIISGEGAINHKNSTNQWLRDVINQPMVKRNCRFGFKSKKIMSSQTTNKKITNTKVGYWNDISFWIPKNDLTKSLLRGGHGPPNFLSHQLHLSA
jgi:hypothetical protein